jgi:glycosyltransferase involved in cell wall biosynthesis
MKVMVTLDFPPEIGGIQRYLLGIVQHTFSKDDRVLVGCSRRVEGGPVESPAPVRRFSTPFSRWNKKLSCIPLFFYFVKTMLALKGPCEVSCGNVYAACVPWAASFFMKKLDYAVYTYGTELLALKKASIKARLLKKVFAKAGRIYALGQFTALQLREIGIAAKPLIVPPRIELVPEIIGRALMPERKADCADLDNISILSVGRLVRHKGHGILLEAVSLLPQGLPWTCVIVGNGPLRDALLSDAAAKKIDDRVSILSGLSDEALWDEYGKASVFVLPSLMDNGAEGFGIVLLEAMSRWVPVIACAAGGVAEVLDNGACGVLVEPGNAPALAGAILRLHGDPELRRRLSLSAYERVRISYAW